MLRLFFWCLSPSTKNTWASFYNLLTLLMSWELLNRGESVYWDIQMCSLTQSFSLFETMEVWVESCNIDWLWQHQNEANEYPNEEMPAMLPRSNHTRSLWPRERRAKAAAKTPQMTDPYWSTSSVYIFSTLILCLYLKFLI